MITAGILDPLNALIIPYYAIINFLNLYDTRLGLILVYCAVGLPVSTFILTEFFKGIPKEIEESAMIEGASVRQRFLYIIVPITSPGIAASAILTAFLSWNEFLIASSVARRKASVLSMSVASYVTDKGILWGQMAAMSIIMILPMILFASVSSVSKSFFQESQKSQ